MGQIIRIGRFVLKKKMLRLLTHSRLTRFEKQSIENTFLT